jgi:hypothetical protein
MLAPLLTLIITVCTAVGQTQEKKLVDRLLRPDTSMANPAQEKKFAITGAVSSEKRVPARNFYSPKTTLTKSFPDERALTPQHLAARHFRLGDSQANLSPRTELAQKERNISPPAAPGVRTARESLTIAPTREFAASRPFLGRGKSQRELRAYNRPLTIEQVRELLNKSK